MVVIAWGLIKIFGWLDKLEANILGPTLVGFVTVIGSVITVVWAKRSEKKKDIEMQLRIKRAELYESFVRDWFRYLSLTNTGNEEEANEVLANAIGKFPWQLLTWGSDEVLQKFVAFRVNTAKKLEENPQEMRPVLFQFEEMLLAMRIDLGYKKTNLPQGMLLALFINDIDRIVDVNVLLGKQSKASHN